VNSLPILTDFSQATLLMRPATRWSRGRNVRMARKPGAPSRKATFRLIVSIPAGALLRLNPAHLFI
jgi:hypothetical protein